MKRVVFAASLATVALGGCPDPQARGKLSILQQEVFTPSCAQASCHSGAAPQAGLDLTDGNSYFSLVDVDSTIWLGHKRVVPGDPAGSALFQSVQGTGPIAQMPYLKPRLPQGDIEAIAAWIVDGAKDN